MTRLRCGGIFNDSFIGNFLQTVIAKDFKNRSVFDEVMPEILQTLFSGHGVLLKNQLMLSLLTNRNLITRI